MSLAAAPPAPPSGTLPGRVVDVREVDIGQFAGSRAGVAAVLAALGAPAAPAAPGDVTRREIVIRRADGNPVSLGGAFPLLVVGERVMIISGPITTVVPGG